MVWKIVNTLILQRALTYTISTSENAFLLILQIKCMVSFFQSINIPLEFDASIFYQGTGYFLLTAAVLYRNAHYMAVVKTKSEW